MKNWVKWTFFILWTLFLIFTAQFWNPFVSVGALLKYTVVSVVAAGVYGALLILIQIFVLLSIIFPLPPRADSKAPKSVWKRAFKFLFKESPISPKAPQTLDEMSGNEKAKVEIREVIELLAKSKHYEESGGQVPKGMLFIGPPGVGKTLFARAIANEVGVPFYVVEGGNFSGLIMGLGVLKLKTLFHKLRDHDRAILFIDEIDSMGSRRQQDTGGGGMADMNMTLNTLLTEMDGFHGSRLMVIGATNNDAMLDPALMRAGRMDRRIYFEMPRPEERADLFKYYLGKVVCAENIDYDQITMLTNGYSPAEIANVVNEAALISRRDGNPGKVNTEMILKALDKVSVGLERSLGNSGVELIAADPTVKLSDVVGIEDVKQDVAEIVDFLKRGDELRSIGAKLPTGVIMVGPPGVGKSMLANAIANEADVPFYGLSASTFISMYYGQGAARIRALYTRARQSPAAIVFIDEIDAIAGTSGPERDLGSRRTVELNQILVELGGIGRSNVVTICATNQEAGLDAAFYRSGRFDRKVYVGLPDRDGRRELFQKYIAKLKLEAEPDLDLLAKLSVNFSGADIAAACNEAAILAVRAGKNAVTEEELEGAIEKVSVTAMHKVNVGGMNMSKLDDIQGMEEAKAEAAEVVAMLKHMDLVNQTGLKAPKGVLLSGQPGTGKTMLAKAIANEAGVAFYALAGTDFQSMWAGVGSNRVRAAYEQARRSGKPAIVFIDEIDAIGGSRGRDLGGGAIQDSNKTLNALLVEMDGFGRHKVLTIGATNRVGMLDSALTRPGRFDRIIEVPMPNLEGREAILQHYLAELELTLDADVNLMEIARMTVMKSGADVSNIVNEAGLGAIRDGRLVINHSDLVTAIQRVSFGINRSQKVSTEELLETCYHEAGHTIVAYFRNKRDRIQVVTIIPTGGALGYMWSVTKEDAFYSHRNKQDYLATIEVSLGGYCAEELFTETTTSGVSSDLQNVARAASSMIRQYGMGSFVFNTYSAFGSRGKGSGTTEREIEMEIKKVVDDCLGNVRQLLLAKRSELDKIARGLYEKETLYYKDLVHILEPDRTEEDINREIETLTERKTVGKAPIINIDRLPGLPPKGTFTSRKGTRKSKDKDDASKKDAEPSDDSSKGT
jgi:ATP-dependent metalloprotease FtsH